VRIGIVAAALTSAVLVASATEVAAQATDVLTIGTVSVSSGTGQVAVPIFIQDNTGTPIGRDMGAGLRISGFAIQVVYGPNSCIDTPASASQRIDLTGGILAGQSADFDSRVKVANTSQSWLYSSAETNGLIPFTAAPAPGDQIGAMVFNLTGCPAGPINLVITTAGAAAAKLNSDFAVSETVGNGSLSVANGAINIVPKGDFNGDGQTDILWRHTSGLVLTWLMNGTTVTSGVSLPFADPSWSIVGTADFNGDGQTDILWRHTSGAVFIWLMNGTTVTSGVSLPPADPSWSIAGAGDFNGDGKPDILWRHTSGLVLIWLMNGTTVTSGVSLPAADPSWSIVGPK
jgi:hypothetical protein